ncbi:hypothetical protein ABTL65_19805, partial [Acinetobacter baumannii]
MQDQLDGDDPRHFPWHALERPQRDGHAEREQRDRSDFSGYKEAAHYGWGGSGDGSRSRDELRALDMLGLDPDA